MVNRIAGNAAAAYAHANAQRASAAKAERGGGADADPFNEIARERVKKGQGTDRLIPSQPSARTEAPRSTPADSTAAIAELRTSNDLRRNERSRAATSARAAEAQPRRQELFNAEAEMVRGDDPEKGRLLDVMG